MIYDGIEYKLTDYGAVIVKMNKNRRVVEIPQFFDKQPVVEIGELAFANCSKLEEVIIPDTVDNIGMYAFSGCTRLKKVLFESQYEEVFVDEGAFYNCSSLEYINAPVSLTKTSTFQGCTKLESISIRGDIPNSTFTNCQNLKEIHWYGVGSGICINTDNAFEQCNNIKEFYIYTDLVDIDKEDLCRLNDAIICCEEDCNILSLVYEGYKIIVADYNLPF